MKGSRSSLLALMYYISIPAKVCRLSIYLTFELL